jgi:hypothetical protein
MLSHNKQGVLIMDLKSLYEQKGQIVTELEILQARLTNVNKQILEFINARKPTPVDKQEEVNNNG